MKIVCFVLALLLIHSTTTLSDENTTRKSLIEQLNEVEKRASAGIKPEKITQNAKQTTKNEKLNIIT